MHTQNSAQTEKTYTVTFLPGDNVLRPAVGIAPLGYKKIASDDKIFVVHDEKAAPKVMLAFELAARGTSFRKILEILTAEGLRSSRGNALSLSSLHSMLTNPFYVGDFRTARIAWQGNHTPLVSKTLFRRVQRTLNAKAKRYTRALKTISLFMPDPSGSTEMSG